MHSIVTKLVILWLFVGSGLIAFGLGFVALAAAMAFFSVDTTDRPPLAAFMEAGCEIESSLMNPSTIGMESRVLRFIAIDPDHGIDFRALPDRWRQVCLTSVSSGSPDLSGGYRLPFLRFERSLCWGWSRRAITVLLIEENGANVSLSAERAGRHWRSRRRHEPFNMLAGQGRTGEMPERRRHLSILPVRVPRQRALTRAYCRQSLPLPSIWRSAAFQ
jgi:hypothetical protein